MMAVTFSLWEMASKTWLKTRLAHTHGVARRSAFVYLSVMFENLGYFLEVPSWVPTALCVKLHVDLGDT